MFNINRAVALLVYDMNCSKERENNVVSEEQDKLVFDASGLRVSTILSYLELVKFLNIKKLLLLKY